MKLRDRSQRGGNGFPANKRRSTETAGQRRVRAYAEERARGRARGKVI